MKDRIKLEYGDKFMFVNEKTGNLPSETMAFKYSIEAGVPLIFIKERGDSFMYASLAGQHERKIEALDYCVKF